MRIVPVEIAEGFYLAEDVYDHFGRVLMRGGVCIAERMVAQLKNAGIFSVYINDQYSQNRLTPPISTDLKVEITRELQNMYEILRLRFEAGREVSESTLRPLGRVLEIADHILYEITRTPRQYLSFTDIKIQELYTVSHSVNVAVLSLLLGMDAGLDRNRQRDVFLGALFHDIGMNFINEKIFLKNGKLDVQEFLKIKEHPQKGYELIKDFSFANSYIKIIVLEHHEKLDGSGYPNQLPDQKIHQLAKIVSVADSYDAMTSDRSYSRAVSPFEAMQHITQSGGRHLDTKLVDLFIRKIMPYPEGSLVKLSNQATALVVTVRENDPIRPIVLPIDAVTKKLQSIPIDLTLEHDIRIEQIQYKV